ncbi:MAG: hypothetical protein DLM66_14870 [Candidatus Dormiibacter spiritus]|nr:MAG: hypothetical protein DLM66_14870 [Candidatus Dormibacteraeota bacterium]
MLAQEAGGRAVGADLVGGLAEAVTLVLEDQVLDRPAELAQALHHLVGLRLHHPGVRGALNDEQRRPGLLDVGDGGALDEEVPVGLRVTDPHFHEPLPEGRHRGGEGDQIAGSEEVHRAGPVLR